MKKSKKSQGESQPEKSKKSNKISRENQEKKSKIHEKKVKNEIKWLP